MALFTYGASVPVFTRALGNLSGLLAKGLASAEARDFDPAVLVLGAPGARTCCC